MRPDHSAAPAAPRSLLPFGLTVAAILVLALFSKRDAELDEAAHAAQTVPPTTLVVLVEGARPSPSQLAPAR